jgi:hypothetical protein
VRGLCARPKRTPRAAASGVRPSCYDEAVAEHGDAENIWFIRRHDDLFEQAGFSRALREKAVHALAELYTPSVLKQLRTGADQEFSAPIFGIGWPLLVVPFLEVGLDLCEVGFAAAAPLAKRLFVPNQFRDAAFELRVWASLHRSGYTVTRVQETQAKTPDYLVKRDGLDVDLEVKMVNESAADDLADEINRSVAETIDVVPGFALRLLGDQQLGARLLDSRLHAALRVESERIVAAFGQTVESVRQHGRPGRYPVTGYGFVEADATRTHPRLTPDLFPQQSDEKKAQRVLRLLRDAKLQATRERPLVAVVGIFHRANPVVVEQELRAQVTRDGKCLQPLELVVLVEMMRNNTTDYSAMRLCYPIPVRRGRTLTQAQRRIAAAAGGSFRGPAKEIRASLPGEQGITLGPARRATTRVLLKQLSADPAAPIRVNPLDPENTD